MRPDVVFTVIFGRDGEVLATPTGATSGDAAGVDTMNR
jgi:hypothetical protein